MHEGRPNLTAIILFTVAVIFALWALFGYLVYAGLCDWQTRGHFGDMFGAVNALFSGLALAGVIVAIILQNQELSLQRQELELNRKELARSADAQEETRSALSKQVRLMAFTAYSQALIGRIEASYKTSISTPDEMKDLKVVISTLREEIKKFDA